MKNILIISGHSNIDSSTANKTILQEIKSNISETRIEYLDKLYPDYKINALAEQEKLVWADIVVLQFPMHWYNMPSILSRWFEITFKHGFSHGSTGNKLLGKKLIISLTSGTPEENYRVDGKVGHEIFEYLLPILSTARLCKMDFVDYVYTGGMALPNKDDYSKKDLVIQKSVLHAKRVINILSSLI